MAFLPVLAAIGGIASVGGQVIGAISSKNQADYEADVANTNAKISRQQAAAEAARTRRDTQRRLSASRTAIAASGVTLEGSPLDLLQDQAMIGHEDAALQEYGGEARAAGFRGEAAAARSRGTASLLGGLGTAGGTALTSAATFKQTFGDD